MTSAATAAVAAAAGAGAAAHHQVQEELLRCDDDDGDDTTNDCGCDADGDRHGGDPLLLLPHPHGHHHNPIVIHDKDEQNGDDRRKPQPRSHQSLTKPRPSSSSSPVSALLLVLLAVLLASSVLLLGPPRPPHSHPHTTPAPTAAASDTATAADPLLLPAALHARLATLAATAPPPIPAAAHHARQRALAARLRAANISAFVAEPTSSAAAYLLGPALALWSLSERPFLVVVLAAASTSDGDNEPATVAFVVPAFEARRAAAIAARAAAEVPPALHTWEEDGSAFDVVRGLLGPTATTIGVDGSSRAFIHTGLDQPSVGLRAVDGTFLVAELRAVKSAAEVSLLRHASVATKAAVAAVARSVSAGMTEAAVGAMVRGALRAAGLGDPWALVLFDQDAAFPHGTEGGEDGGDGGGEVARLRDDGSVVLIDAGGDVHGYQSDVTRTFWFAGARGGAAVPAAVRAAWDAVRAGQVAAIAAAAAADGAGGAKCGAVDAAARDEIARRGYGPGYRYFTHRLGHGIGLDGHEPPYMTRGAERLVAAGNAFTVEPGVYVAGEFGVRIEDMVVVVDEEEEGEGGTVRRSVVVLGAESKSIDDPFDGHL